MIVLPRNVRQHQVRMRDITVEFEMPWRHGDVNFDAIRVAFINATTLEFATLEFAALEQPREGMAKGPKGSFGVISFSRTNRLDDSVLASVTLKLPTCTEWITFGTKAGLYLGPDGTAIGAMTLVENARDVTLFWRTRHDEADVSIREQGV